MKKVIIPTFAALAIVASCAQSPAEQGADADSTKTDTTAAASVQKATPKVDTIKADLIGREQTRVDSTARAIRDQSEKEMLANWAGTYGEFQTKLKLQTDPGNGTLKGWLHAFSEPTQLELSCNVERATVSEKYENILVLYCTNVQYIFYYRNRPERKFPSSDFTCRLRHEKGMDYELSPLFFEGHPDCVRVRKQ